MGQFFTNTARLLTPKWSLALIGKNIFFFASRVPGQWSPLSQQLGELPGLDIQGGGLKIWNKVTLVYS